MAGRVLFVESRCKLSFSNNYLLVDGVDGVGKYYLDDIEAVVFSSLAVSMSAYLLNELATKGKTVVFCDDRRFPCSGLIPLYGVQSAYAKIKEQIHWQESAKASVWRSIVIGKIHCQQEVLSANGLEYSFEETVQENDAGNAEGRFADHYFHRLFGRNFRRHLTDDLNIALNYGYTILCSAMARIAAGHGYIPSLGIHHCGETNNINLACDCVEPFRPAVDEVVFKCGKKKLDKEYKAELILVLNREIYYRGSCCSVRYAMERYFSDVVSSMRNNEVDLGEIRLH